MDRKHHENPKARIRSVSGRASSLRSPTKTPGCHLARHASRREPRIHLDFQKSRRSRDRNPRARTARGWNARHHDTHFRRASRPPLRLALSFANAALSPTRSKRPEIPQRTNRKLTSLRRFNRYRFVASNAPAGIGPTIVECDHRPVNVLGQNRVPPAPDPQSMQFVGHCTESVDIPSSQ
jgi:hypothetical protein